MRRHEALRLVLAAWVALVTTGAVAADYPAKSIRLIVPAPAGGTPDIQSRVIASELSRQMGQQVVVDNRGGASGIIGLDVIAKGAPDGYTFGYAPFQFITNPLVFAKLPYDTSRDFQPVVLQTSGGNFLTVTPSLAARNVRDLIALARAQPGTLSYGGTGAGSSNQLAIELLKTMTGTQIVQVSYKSIPQAITDTVAGQVHIICDNVTSILPYIRSTRLRAIGFTLLQRSVAAPDIPTLDESGLQGFEVAPSSGYVLPGRTPRDIVLRLNTEINKAFKSHGVSEKFLANGSVIHGGTPEQFAEHLRRETVKWAEVIKAAGIKPQ